MTVPLIAGAVAVFACVASFSECPFNRQLTGAQEVDSNKGVFIFIVVGLNEESV